MYFYENYYLKSSESSLLNLANVIIAFVYKIVASKHVQNMFTLVYVGLFLITISIPATSEIELNCNTLLRGQFLCPDPAINHIDSKTQQPINCNEKNKAKIWCIAADGIICSQTKNSSFLGEVPCRWTNGYHFDTALMLSVFLGMFGIDRFYLGYYGIGLMKFCTLGFMFIGHLVDVILIATQAVGPSDGSSYIIPYFGPGISVIRSDNSTYRRPQPDW